MVQPYKNGSTPSYEDVQRVSATHAADLRRFKEPLNKRHTGSYVELARKHFLFSLVRTTFLVGQAIVATLLNPSLPLTDPYGFLKFGVLYSILFVSLAVGQVILLVSGILGLDRFVGWLCSRYGGGTSVVNCLRPYMFDDDGVVRRASVVLSSASDVQGYRDLYGKKRGSTCPSVLGGTRVVKFELDVARALLLMCSVMYERNEALVHQESATKGSDFSDQLLLHANDKIYAAAEKWNVRFVSITDCVSAGGCWVGAFLSPYSTNGNPWIVLVCKGTSPIHSAEWLSEVNFARESAEDHLWGSCHQGMYTTLFPCNGADVPFTPYQRILSGTLFLSSILSSESENRLPTNIFVAGHSLGAGLASLLYARLLVDQEILEEGGARLRDGYTFGTPAVGDGSFIAGFDRLLDAPVNTSKSFFRISNSSDFIAISPPGLAGRRVNRSNISSGSLFDYGPIGIEVHLDERESEGWHVHPWTLTCGTELKVVTGVMEINGEREDKKWKEKAKEGEWNPLLAIGGMMKKFLPSLYDHAPSSYWTALEQVIPHDRGGGTTRDKDH